MHEQGIYEAFDTPGQHVIDTWVLGMRRWVICDAEGTLRPVVGISVADALAVDALYGDVKARNIIPASTQELVSGTYFGRSTEPTILIRL